MNFTQTDKAGVVECFALVKKADKKTSKNGSFYLDIVVADKEGEMFAKMWDYKEEIVPIPEVNTVIKIRGTLQQYNGKDQLIIQKIRPTVAGDNVSVSDFVKSADITGEEMYEIIMSLVASFEDEELKSVVTAIYEEKKEDLLYFPAAEKLHHAMRGGLLYHTLSIVRLAESVCAVYPSLDKELLISGAILHDISKIKEYSVNDAGLVDGHTLSGMLLGHLVMGSEEVGKKCDELGISEKTKYLLQHMLISHHGKFEFGSAVRPSFIEAEILSQLDLMDANIFEMEEAIKGVKSDEFTGNLWMLDNRKMLNHGRKPIETTANLGDK